MDKLPEDFFFFFELYSISSFLLAYRSLLEIYAEPGGVQNTAVHSSSAHPKIKQLKRHMMDLKHLCCELPLHDSNTTTKLKKKKN